MLIKFNAVLFDQLLPQHKSHFTVEVFAYMKNANTKAAGCGQRWHFNISMFFYLTKHPPEQVS